MPCEHGQTENICLEGCDICASCGITLDRKTGIHEVAGFLGDSMEAYCNDCWELNS